MKEDLMFCSLGNGVTICDRSRIEHGDYMIVAHISYERKVTYYHAVSEESKRRIEAFALNENMNQSTTQPYPVLKEKQK